MVDDLRVLAWIAINKDAINEIMRLALTNKARWECYKRPDLPYYSRRTLPGVDSTKYGFGPHSDWAEAENVFRSLARSVLFSSDYSRYAELFRLLVDKYDNEGSV